MAVSASASRGAVGDVGGIGGFGVGRIDIDRGDVQPVGTQPVGDRRSDAGAASGHDRGLHAQALVFNNRRHQESSFRL